MNEKMKKWLENEIEELKFNKANNNMLNARYSEAIRIKTVFEEIEKSEDKDG